MDKNKYINIIFVSNEKITSDAVEVANTLNNFSSNFVKNLKIREYYIEDKLPHRLSRHLTLNAILKYKNHPSIGFIIIIFPVFPFSSFYFSQVDKNTVL